MPPKASSASSPCSTARSRGSLSRQRIGHRTLDVRSARHRCRVGSRALVLLVSGDRFGPKRHQFATAQIAKSTPHARSRLDEARGHLSVVNGVQVLRLPCLDGPHRCPTSVDHGKARNALWRSECQEVALVDVHETPVEIRRQQSNRDGSRTGTDDSACIHLDHRSPTHAPFVSRPALPGVRRTPGISCEAPKLAALRQLHPLVGPPRRSLDGVDFMLSVVQCEAGWVGW